MAKNNKTQPTPVEDIVDVQVPQEEAPVEQEVDVPETQEPVTPEVEVADVQVDESDESPEHIETEAEERLRLAKELNLTVRTDQHTGKPILPSTPAMRAAAALAARKTTVPVVGMDIENFVVQTYGDAVAQNPNIKLIISTLADYIKRMSPGASIDEKTGGEIQAAAANMYDVVLSLKPEFAQVGLEIIVAVVKQNLRGAFSETAAMRFANTMPLNTERSIRFQLLTTLFMSLAAGTKKRDLAKVINVRQLVEYISDRNAKANISEFIN